MLPALVGPSMLLDLYSDLIEGAGPMDAFKLTQGFDNSSLRAGEDLWKLSQTVVDSDWLRRSGNQSTARVWESIYRGRWDTQRLTKR